MHFRVRKNVIQCIRTHYDPGKKKGVNQIVGTVNLLDPTPSAELREALSPAELGEFEAWLDTRHRVDRLREEFAALTLAETMAEAEHWFRREGDSRTARAIAVDIVTQWQSLRKSLAKSGLME